MANSFSGFVALGTLTAGTFTESAAAGYARMPWVFGPLSGGYMQGTTNGYFPNGGTAWTYNALAFFPNVSGGAPVLVYPLAAIGANSPGIANVVYGSNVRLNCEDMLTGDGLALSPAGVWSMTNRAVSGGTIDNAVIGGVTPAAATFTNATVTGFLLESFVDNITASATQSQAGSTVMTAELNRVGVCAAVGNAVRLPPSASGLTIYVINHGANAVQVFGAGSDAIDDLPAASGVSQMVNSMVVYTCTTAGAWYSNGLGTGFAGQYPTVSYSNGLTANATQSQAGGLSAGSAIATCIARVTTVATAGNANTMPVSAPGMSITVSNAGSASLSLFPNTGDTINSLGVNAAFNLAAGKSVALTCAVAGFWHAISA